MERAVFYVYSKKYCYIAVYYFNVKPGLRCALEKWTAVLLKGVRGAWKQQRVK